ncbi:MAG: hypothetical protein ABIF71_04640 [Planctomycetota bacterium]
MELFRWACEGAADPTPLAPAEETKLIQTARSLDHIFPEPAPK